MMNISDLKLYKKYKLTDLIEIFNNGAFQYGQGMVYTKDKNTLVLISKHTKDKLYQDELKNGKIYYTGMGQNGDQVVALQNKRLVNAKTSNTTVYMFLVFKKNEYTYYGRVSLEDPYYYDIEPDLQGIDRHVLKFPLTFLDAFAPMSHEELTDNIISGTIPELRVVGACICKDGSYLLSQRSSQQGYEGKWEFPGGKINPGETDIDAIKREIKEEIGVDIDVLDELDTTSFFEKDKNRIIKLKVFNCAIVNGTPTSKEGQKLEWKKLDEIENLELMPSDVEIVQTLIDKSPRKIVDIIDFSYKEGKKKTPKPSEIKRECQDYEKSQKRKAKAGKEAELAVIEFEINKLKDLGRCDLASQIKQVSTISSDYGYDILSYDVVNGKDKEIHIEVKTATRVGDKIEFFVSQAELRNCINDEDYKIYALIRYGRDFKLHIIKREEFISDARYLSPVSYKVSIPVEEL